MMNISWVGSIAAVLTTISFVPQAWRVIRTKNVEGISLGMYVLFAVGVYLWLIYGVAVRDWNITIANGITAFLASIILTVTIKYKGKH